MERVACPHCDLVHAPFSLRQGEEARCSRCATALPRTPLPADAHKAAAIVATALVAFVVAVSTPLMRLSGLGRDAEASLPGSAAYMWFEGSHVAAIFVALFTKVLPGAYLLLALAARLGETRSPAPRWADRAARWSRLVTPWAMPEVMLLAALVAYVKISQVAPAAPGIGLYATAALAAMLALARDGSQARVSALIRKPLPAGSSLATSKALLLAASVCYVPANLLPVLITNTTDGAEADTILDGVQALHQSGSWFLALIVLVASFVIPLAKIGALAYLCLVVEKGIAAPRRESARLFGVLEVAGRWSMLDVFVDAFVVALVQLPPFLWVRPGAGVPFFAATAVLTMLAYMAFDKRLLWSLREQELRHG